MHYLHNQNRKKTNIGLDLDQTTGDFVGSFREFLQKKYSLTYEEAMKKYPDPKNYSFYESGWFNNKNEFLRDFHEAEESGIYLRMEPMENAKKVLKRLPKDEYEISIITARNSRWNDDSLKWLENHQIPFTNFVNSSIKYDVPEIDIYIDDSNSNYVNLSKHKKTTILYTASYNLDIPAELRANNWKDIQKILKTL